MLAVEAVVLVRSGARVVVGGGGCVGAEVSKTTSLPPSPLEMMVSSLPSPEPLPLPKNKW